MCFTVFDRCRVGPDGLRPDQTVHCSGWDDGNDDDYDNSDDYSDYDYYDDHNDYDH